MQFTYHEQAGEDSFSIDGDLYRYLFKVRRTAASSKLYFRNLKNHILYQYEVINISKKEANVQLISFEEKRITLDKKLHIGWCKIDFKSIEKIIASLNEMGVDKITFIECEYSQRNTKINFEKLEKLLINSSMQCGRSDMITLESASSMDVFLKTYPDSYMFHFSSNHINTQKEHIKTIILGCEGGFSDKEVASIDPDKIVGIDSNIILRSESAATVIASQILL